MFSVIIPLYNKVQSITATLNSVLGQSFPDFEIVLVNDGSTDGSLQVAQQIQDPRIRIIDKENGGVSSARNRGIEEAKYEWITFLDGDDLWKKDHLEHYNQAISFDSTLLWLLSGYTSDSEKGKALQFVYNKNGRLENIFDDLLKGLKIHTSAVCIRKSLFSLHTGLYFRLGINNSEDREVWYKLCCIDQSPFYIKKSLSIYKRDDVNSLTKNSSQIGNDHFLDLALRIEEFPPFANLKTLSKKKMFEYIRIFNKKAIIGNYLRNRQFKKSYMDYLKMHEWLLFNYTIKFPATIKKILAKIC